MIQGKSVNSLFAYDRSGSAAVVVIVSFYGAMRLAPPTSSKEQEKLYQDNRRSPFYEAASVFLRLSKEMGQNTLTKSL